MDLNALSIAQGQLRTERHTDRQRETGGQAGRDTVYTRGEREIHTQKETYTESERQRKVRGRQTDRQRETESERLKPMLQS